jgi:HK97 family phage major capsid protein
MKKFALNLQFHTYSNKIDRTGSEALIPEDAAKEIIQGIPQFSAIMQLATKAPNMSTKQRRMPVLSSLPTAYFVNGDTGLKQTSKVEWGNKFLDAEELAVIIPIPEAVLDDTAYDIWGEVKPRIMEAIGFAFDQAVLFGVNAPASWPTNVVAGALAAGNKVALGTGSDLYDDLLGLGGVISLVEADGYMPNGHIAHLTMRARLRGLRDLEGQPLFKNSMQSNSQYDLDGAPIYFPQNGSIDNSKVHMITGDFKQLIYAMRQDVTYKILDQAVIQDNTGAIVYNLAQQDMIALRAVVRLAWQIPNPINRINATGTRYPFATLTPAG